MALKNNFAFFALTISFLLLSSAGFGQTASVKGKVNASGEPVIGALVLIENLNLSQLTDTLGTFHFTQLLEGSYTIRVQALDHQNYERTITLKAGETKKFDVYLNPTTSELGEVVITGTMKEVRKTSSPIPVEVYTPEYFKKNPTPNLFESLQIVNGVQPQLNCNVCNTGDIHINGMEGPYTMITIDGMPIVSSLSTVYGLSGIPNSMVQRIEVVKGPASTLYGSEAVGGLINIITKDPSTSPRGTIDVFATSQREYNADVAVRNTVGKHTSLLGINYYNFKNKLDINKDNFTDVTLQDRISVFNKWSFKRKHNRLASIAGRFIYEDRWGGELNYNHSFRGKDSVYGESIFTKRYELIGVYQLPLKEKITFQFSLNSHHQNSVYGTTPFIAIQNIAFAQLLYDKKLSARHDLLIGLPFRYIYYDDNTPGTSYSDSYEPGNKPQKTFLPGVFVQEEFSFNTKLKSLAGLRYDYNSIHGSILTPRLSFKYDLSKTTIVRLSGGNGYRVVNLFTEDHAALTGAREVVITQELQPEQSYNVNLNLQKFINTKNGFAGLDLTFFYTYFTNKIIGDFLTDPDKIIYDNLNGYAVSKGITLNTDFSFSFPLKIITGVTLMDVYSVQKDGRISEKVQQLHAPKVSGTFAVTYKIHSLGIAIDYTGRVTGPMELPVQPNDYRPSVSPWFSLQNIQITKKINKQFEVYGGVKNLLNYRPKHSLMRPEDPFDKRVDDPVSNPNGYTFDTSYNYAPIQGIRGFAGLRWILQ
jgi:outer membrane receptor for ferrienterochelin and colicins